MTTRRTLYAEPAGRDTYRCWFYVDAYRTRHYSAMTRGAVEQIARYDTPTMRIVWVK